MNTILKDILAVLAGVFLGAITVMGIQVLGHALYPLPEAIDPENVNSIAAHMNEISIGAMLFVLLAWFVGAGAGVLLSIKAAPVRKKCRGAGWFHSMAHGAPDPKHVAPSQMDDGGGPACGTFWQPSWCFWPWGRNPTKKKRSKFLRF